MGAERDNLLNEWRTTGDFDLQTLAVILDTVELLDGIFSITLIRKVGKTEAILQI